MQRALSRRDNNFYDVLFSIELHSSFFSPKKEKKKTLFIHTHTYDFQIYVFIQIRVPASIIKCTFVPLSIAGNNIIVCNICADA